MKTSCCFLILLFSACCLSPCLARADDAAAQRRPIRIRAIGLPIRRRRCRGRNSNPRPVRHLGRAKSSSSPARPTPCWLSKRARWRRCWRSRPPASSRSIRHMGWEGDTVYEQNRAMNFGGWQRAVRRGRGFDHFPGSARSKRSTTSTATKHFAAAYDQAAERIRQDDAAAGGRLAGAVREAGRPLGSRQHAAQRAAETPGGDSPPAWPRSTARSLSICFRSLAAGPSHLSATADRGWHAPGRRLGRRWWPKSSCQTVGAECQPPNCSDHAALRPGNRPQEPVLVRLLADDELGLSLWRSDLGRVQPADRRASQPGQGTGSSTSR